MRKSYDLTQGSVWKNLLKFMLPFLFANIMQAFYGAVDLFVVGRFSGTSAISAVNIGSQILQIITSFVIGISMGITVALAHNIGSKDKAGAVKTVSNGVLLFVVFAVVVTPLMIWKSGMLVEVMQTPADAVHEATQYVLICSIGLPFIIIYNVIAALLRGIGNSKTPMLFVGVACVVNVAGDFLLTGFLHMGVTGAAIATVVAQMISSLCGLIYLKYCGLSFPFRKSDLHFHKSSLHRILVVGFPVALQDTLINISFIVLTVIANERGLIASSAVGVVEKLIMFMFLVPSAMLSAISAITAQNLGAHRPERATATVKYGIWITAAFGILMCAVSQLFPDALTSIFSRDTAVIQSAGEYLRTYSIDCILVAFTFCMNGYLCGMNRSVVTLFHNTLSILLVRIPAAYFLSRCYPNSLLPMGLASPLGSLLSIVILIGYFSYHKKKSMSLQEQK
jgi:putative efflux protein, MATE family